MYNPLKLLICDDSTFDIELLQHTISEKKLPWEVLIKHSSQQCLDYLESLIPESRLCTLNLTPSPLPNLIILDINMPGMTGIQLLPKIKAFEELRTIPVIMFTSSTNKADVKAAYEQGAASYLVKPMHIEDLGDLVQKVHNYWAEENTFADKTKGF